MDSIFEALADPRRRQIVELLMERERRVGELVEALPIAQSGVSRHLRLLREAGVVQVRRDGQARVYALSEEPLHELDAWLQRWRAQWESRLDRFELALERKKRAMKLQGEQGES